MKFLGFELTSETLQKFPIFGYILLILITLSAIKLAFGKEIIWLIKKVWEKFLKRDQSRTHNDWIANCINREGWYQKGDAEFINLEERYIKKLSFNIYPIGKPTNWRAGFILGNEKFHPQQIVDKDNAITIHAGSPPPIARAQHFWIYDWNHGRDKPDSTTIKMIDKRKIYFKISVNNNNFLFKLF